MAALSGQLPSAHLATPGVASPARIPGLDGLRAVSIALVIFSHVLQTYQLTQSLPFVWRLEAGATGVSVFFVISGYLITTLMLRERDATGHISLQAFYIRRFFRIVPAYLAFLLVVVVLKAYGLVILDWQDFVPAFFYLSNYFQVGRVLLHTWSLSVEEQFYLLFPLLLVYLRRHNLTALLLAALGISVLARLGNQILGIWPFNAMYSFEGRADQLAFGCLCALVQHRASARHHASLLRWAPYASAFLLCCAVAMPVGALRTLLFNTFVGAATALLIFSCAGNPRLWVTRLLENAALRAIGLMSYSLYLWQQVWLAPELGFSLATALAGALCSAAVSYLTIERWGLKARNMILRDRGALATRA